MFFVLLFSSAHSDLSTFCPSHLKATYKNMVVLENTLRNAHASLKTILLLAVGSSKIRMRPGAALKMDSVKLPWFNPPPVMIA